MSCSRDGPSAEIEADRLKDPAQSGYLPDHNMDPAAVGSPSFGILWKNAYNTNEMFYAKPLTLTPNSTQNQIVFLASSMNIIRTVDAVTGTLINSRTIQPPFLESDIECTDIPNFIGIIGTPIIDPVTEIVYFFSKGYEGQASGGGILLGAFCGYSSLSPYFLTPSREVLSIRCIYRHSYRLVWLPC
jgi:iron transport multicopper oxidase